MAARVDKGGAGCQHPGSAATAPRRDIEPHVFHLRTLPAVGCLSLLLLAAGCASAPTQEMSDARQALGAAREARAKVFAPRLMEEADRSLDGAVTALRAHDFAAARAGALTARGHALDARRLALALGAARAGLRTADDRGISKAAIRRLLTAAAAAQRRHEVRRAILLAEQAARAARDGIVP